MQQTMSPLSPLLQLKKRQKEVSKDNSKADTTHCPSWATFIYSQGQTSDPTNWPMGNKFYPLRLLKGQPDIPSGVGIRELLRRQVASIVFRNQKSLWRRWRWAALEERLMGADMYNMIGIKWTQPQVPPDNVRFNPSSPGCGQATIIIVKTSCLTL